MTVSTPKGPRSPSLAAAFLRGDLPRDPVPWRTAAAYVASGLALALTASDPAWWSAAWVSVAFLALAMSGTRTTRGAALGMLAVQMLGFYGLDWAPGLNYTVFNHTRLQGEAFRAGQAIAWSTPFAITTGAAFLLLGRRVAPCWWIPVAWGAGESLRFQVMSVSVGDWLNTQWQVPPVLRAVGHLGWWPAHLLCLFAAACVGQAIATRRTALLLPSALAAGLLLTLPPLPNPGLDLLRGVAAMHTGSMVDLPHVAPPPSGPNDAVDLILWPETHLHLKPYLTDGANEGVYLRPLLRGSEATHLIGLETTFPFRGNHNQVVAIGPDGRVATSRAKRLLLPVAERTYLGVGRDRLVPGTGSTVLEVAGRKAVSLICGEALSRALVAEGKADGGQLLLVLARDQMLVNDQAKNALLASQVMRSVEFGIPSVRASYGGWANFVAADGTVLAQSALHTNGLLRWDQEHGARDHDFFGRELHADPPADAPQPSPAPVAVLYSNDAERYRPPCPERRCRYYAIEDFTCDAPQAATVILAGHGEPPDYLGHPAEQIAQAVRCLQPEVVVADACYSASSDLLLALADTGAHIVAAPFLLPTAGLDYLPDFFHDPDPARRAAAIAEPPGGRLLRWKMHRPTLDAALDQARLLEGQDLLDHLRRRTPPYLGVDVEGAGTLLVPIDEARVRQAREANRSTGVPANRRARVWHGESPSRTRPERR